MMSIVRARERHTDIQRLFADKATDTRTQLLDLLRHKWFESVDGTLGEEWR